MINGLNFSEKEHISSLRQSCRRHLQTVFNSFFELASTTLIGMADRAETNRLQTLYLDAQRLLRTRRSAIESLVLERTMDSFSVLDSSLQPSSVNSAVNPGGHNTPYNHLELLGNEDLKVMIALDNSSTAALEAYKQPLYLLHRRFQTLVGGDMDSGKPDPMSPDALLECFSESIRHDLIAVEIQVVLINLFNQICFDRSYGRLLDEVNQNLESAGVLPQPEQTASGLDRPSAAAEQRAVSEQKAVYTDNEAARTDNDLGQRQAVVDKLKIRRPGSLLSAQSYAESSAEVPAEPAPESPRAATGNTSQSIAKTRV